MLGLFARTSAAGPRGLHSGRERCEARDSRGVGVGDDDPDAPRRPLGDCSTHLPEEERGFGAH